MSEPMSGPVRTVILGTGAGFPDNIVTNFDLEKIVDTSDEWITQRTGISERRIAQPHETTLTFALKASQGALQEAGVEPNEIDMVICGTTTPDMTLPSEACLIQSELGIKSAAAFDLKAGCTSWIYAMDVADKFVRCNPDMKILVVGSELLSRSLDWEDRATCVLFGDGAGAAVVTGSAQGNGMLASRIDADGSEWEALSMLAPGTKYNYTHEMIDQKLWAIKMQGNRVFKLAVPAMKRMAEFVLKEAGLTSADVDHFIPHQANIRIMKAVGQRLGIEESKTIVTVNKYGNTSAACIPVALAESVRKGRIKRGDLVLMVSFGGGFTWGGMLMRW